MTYSPLLSLLQTTLPLEGGRVGALPLLQHYWWLIISVLGALLVFMMFVQGANTLIFRVGRTEEERRMLINSTGRKWELTFTTLVTFGGAAFAAFPLFYSTSFGSAYWLWMAILVTFVIQAVSYEFQKKQELARVFQFGLQLNGLLGPLLIGGAVATFFEGSNFVVAKSNLTGVGNPVISSWANASHGLDALLNPWVLVLGFAVVFLTRILGLLYYMNNIDDEPIRQRCRSLLLGQTVPFLILFVAYVAHVLLKEGYAVDAQGIIVLEPMKYFNNLLALWPLAIVLVLGVVLVLYGIIKEIVNRRSGNSTSIWPVGIGTVLTVLVLLLLAGWNNTAFYPSTADLQSSLTIVNASSSEFTLRTMAYVSLLIPFVLAYIAYAWWQMDRKKIDREEIEGNDE